MGASRSRRSRLVRLSAEPNRTSRREGELRRRYDGYDRPPSRRSAGDDDGGWEDEDEEAADGDGGRPPRPPGPQADVLDSFSFRGGPLTGALVAGAFALGIGAGVAFDTVVTLDRDNVASSVMFDRSSPNSDACAAFGASAVVFDQRIFLSFNPCVPRGCAGFCRGCTCTSHAPRAAQVQRVRDAAGGEARLRAAPQQLERAGGPQARRRH